MNTDWKLKIHAFLHDPPHKPLVLGADHEAIGRRLAAKWAGKLADPGAFERWVKPADRVASGADREAFPGGLDKRGIRVDPRRELSLVHPLDGTDLAVRRPEDDTALARQRGEILFTDDDVGAARRVVDRVFDDLAGWVARPPSSACGLAPRSDRLATRVAARPALSVSSGRGPGGHSR